MRYIYAIVLIALLPSCKALKNVSHDVRDSIVIKTVDSVVYRTVTTTKDSLVIKDTAIGISGGEAGFDIDFNSTIDTIIRKGALRITRTVNNGREHIDCTSDSLTVVIADLTSIWHREAVRSDSLRNVVSDINKSYTETTVKEQTGNWLTRLWGKVKNTFAWIGLITVIYIIYRIVKRYFIA